VKANFILLVLSVIVGLFAIEIALRIAGYNPLAQMGVSRQVFLRTSNAPMLQYELIPLAVGQGWGTRVSVNSAGFRDREYPIPRNSGYRIIVLGDSITFGFGLANVEDTYPKQLERLLHDYGLTSEVLNFGVAGYDLVNYVGLLEYRGLQFAPDLVVIGYCLNDIGVASPNREYIEGLNVTWGSRLALLVYRSIQPWRIKRWQSHMNSEKVFAETYKDRILSIDKDPVLIEKVKELSREHQIDPSTGDSGMLSWYTSRAHLGTIVYSFDRLRKLSRERGFRVAVMPIPFLSSSQANKWKIVYDILSHECHEFGFEYVDVHPDLEADGWDNLVITPGDRIHPNTRGHSLLAKKLADYVSLISVTGTIVSK